MNGIGVGNESWLEWTLKEYDVRNILHCTKN